MGLHSAQFLVVYVTLLFVLNVKGVRTIGGFIVKREILPQIFVRSVNWLKEN